MPKASPPPAPPPNRNAPTPSTRLLPSHPQLEFFELKPPANARKTPDPCAPLWPYPGLRPSEGFLSWPGLLIERTERQEPERPDFLPKIRGKYGGTQGTYLYGNSRMPGLRGHRSVEQPG